MSLSTLNNGDSGLDARTKINAAIAAVNAGTILRATGTLQAYTVPGVAATSPPPLQLSFGDPVFVQGNPYYATYSVDGSIYIIAFGNLDPGSNDYWIDSSTFTTADDYAQAFWNYVGTTLPQGGELALTGNDNAGNIEITNLSAAGNSSISCSFSAFGSSSGGGAGTDEIAPVGATTSVDLVPGVSGKSVKIIQAWVFGSMSVDVYAALYGAGTPMTFDYDLAAGVTNMTPYPDPDLLQLWLFGLPGHGVTFEITSDPSVLPTDGSTGTVIILYEQS